MMLLAKAEFRSRTHSNANNKMAAFHHCFLHFESEKKKKEEESDETYCMSKSVLAASLLIWQEMSWGWLIDNVCAIRCAFSNLTLLPVCVIFISVFSHNTN